MNKRKVLFAVIIGTIFSVTLLSYKLYTYTHNINIKPKQLKTKIIAEPNQSDDRKELNSIEKQKKEIKSGAITKLPWENDGAFKKAKKENNTPILMAAYRTVLKDPLPGEEYNVHLAARMLAGIVINPGEMFSQNQKIGPYVESRGFKEGPTYAGTRLITTVGGGVCKIASTLYNVAILSNLEIIERHNHNMPVPYVPYGQDATVAYGGKDIKFKNNTSSPMLIWAQGIGNTLYMGFYGSSKPPKVEWHHEVLNVQKAPKIYKKNFELPKGTEKIILEGMDGGVIKSWVTIKNSDGTSTTKQLGNSYYNPMPYIIEKNN